MQRLFFGRDRRKKRQSPIAKSRPAAVAANPMYQYAIQEYAQTVAPATSNHDGRPSRVQPNRLISPSPPPSSVLSQSSQQSQQQSQSQQRQPSVESSQQQQVDSSLLQDHPSNITHAPLDTAATTIRHSMSAMSALSDDGGGGTAASHASSFRQHRPTSPSAATEAGSVLSARSIMESGLLHTTSYHPWDHVIQDLHQNMQYDDNDTDDDPMIPDASYDEYYGDAYVGAPIKYVYPSGYQSMRPRGGPWKLSILVCLLFTWMSVFIVGHCSDRAAQTLYSTEIDDDAIKKRWCGSRLLYLMWVISMSITGVAAAYCSVIGYIKVRDFSVANCRSQPSVSVGKSDYYIQIQDNNDGDGGGGSQQQPLHGHHQHHHHHIIYQADGTPRFWGAHIYRPTQAAVAVTSR